MSRMTPKRKRQRGKSRAKEQHKQLLAALELADSCCDICHCDCYSSHSSSNASGRGQPSASTETQLKQLDQQIRALEQVQRSEGSARRVRSQSRKISASKSPAEQPRITQSRRGSAECQTRVSTASRSRRSKSAGSQRCPSREASLEARIKEKSSKQRAGRTGGLRDCQMLQVSGT